MSPSFSSSGSTTVDYWSVEWCAMLSLRLSSKRSEKDLAVAGVTRFLAEQVRLPTLCWSASLEIVSILGANRRASMHVCALAVLFVTWQPTAHDCHGLRSLFEFVKILRSGHGKEYWHEFIVHFSNNGRFFPVLSLRRTHESSSLMVQVSRR